MILIYLLHIGMLILAIWTWQNYPPLFGPVIITVLALYLLPVAISAIRGIYHPFMLVEPIILGILFMVWFAFHNHGRMPIEMNNWITCYAPDGVTTAYYGPPDTSNVPNPCYPAVTPLTLGVTPKPGG